MWDLGVDLTGTADPLSDSVQVNQNVCPHTNPNRRLEAVKRLENAWMLVYAG